MIKFTLAAAAIASLVTGNAATARDGTWRIGNDKFHIVYSDIDTNTSAGRAILLKRVERAAVMLCSDQIVRVIRRDCVRAAIDSAAMQPRNKALQIALIENKGMPLAAR